MYLTPETRARREIDKQLEACGWVTLCMIDTYAHRNARRWRVSKTVKKSLAVLHSPGPQAQSLPCSEREASLDAQDPLREPPTQSQADAQETRLSTRPRSLARLITHYRWQDQCSAPTCRLRCGSVSLTRHSVTAGRPHRSCTMRFSSRQSFQPSMTISSLSGPETI